jgi:hypothetical protein
MIFENKSNHRKGFMLFSRGSKKRGQLTMFVVLAVIFTVSIVGFFFLKDSFAPSKYDDGVSAMNDNILDCFEGTYKGLLEVNGLQGGYWQRPDDEYLEAGIVFVPYHYYEGDGRLPTIKMIEKELGEGAKDMIAGCIDIYLERDSSYDLSYDDYEVFVKVYDNEVIFVSDMKLSVGYDNKTVIIDYEDFEISVDSKLSDMYDLSSIIVRQGEDDPEEWIDLTEIHEFADERDLNVTILELEEDSYSYLFVISNNYPEYYPATFQFFNKYNLIDLGFPTGLSVE